MTNINDNPSSQSLAENAIKEGIALHQALLSDFGPQVTHLADLLLETFGRGGRVFLAGNGGSASQAQHIATELVGRFKHKRKSLPAIALTADSTLLTALANDFDFDQVFARQVEALMRPGDLLVALSTSGASPNVLQAVRSARQQGAVTIGFTGSGKGPLNDLVDDLVEVPSVNTQRIQEAHLLLWHIICELVDNAVAAEPGVIKG